MNSDYTPEIDDIDRPSAFGSYSYEDRKIRLRTGNIKKTRRLISEINRNERGARLHRSGILLRNRRSYAEVERRFPGAGKYRDESDLTSRLLAHESLHKALHKAGGETAARKLDDVYAANGYRGIVRRPTHFIVGEAGPERVYIKPLHKIKRRPSYSNFRVNIGIPSTRKTPSIFGSNSLGKLARF